MAGQIKPSSDQYSLALIYLEMLTIEHHCHARLLPTVLKVQLFGFRKQWGADVVSSDANSHVLQVKVGSSVLTRMLGRASTLEVRICFESTDNTLTPVSIEIVPVGCSGQQAAALLESTGPKLLESLRTHLQAQPERRREERLRFEQMVPVVPLLPDGRPGPMIMVQAVNISAGGMRLLLPHQLPTPNLLIKLAAPTAPGDPVAMPARIVRAEECADGKYDVGVCFGLTGE